MRNSVKYYEITAFMLPTKIEISLSNKILNDEIFSNEGRKKYFI